MSYPATVSFEAPEKIDNWRPLVQWILAIPHMVVSSVLNTVAEILAFLSWVIILFTGKLPAGIATFQCMALRYETRVSAYIGFLHSEYPPFDFTPSAADPGGQPIQVDYTPALEDRNRLTVGLRLIWMIPAAIYSIVIIIVAAVLWFVAFFAVLFTGKWPQGLLNFVLGAIRVGTRLNAYAFLLTDEYPPFATD